jgi:hypothetical protein
MEIVRTVVEQGRALMIPVGDPDESSSYDNTFR